MTSRRKFAGATAVRGRPISLPWGRCGEVVYGSAVPARPPVDAALRAIALALGKPRPEQRGFCDACGRAGRVQRMRDRCNLPDCRRKQCPSTVAWFCRDDFDCLWVIECRFIEGDWS